MSDSDNYSAGNIADLINNMDKKQNMGHFAKSIETDLNNFKRPSTPTQTPTQTPISTSKMNQNFEQYEKKMNHIQMNQPKSLPNAVINQDMYYTPGKKMYPEKKKTYIEYIITSSKLPLVISFLFIIFAHPKINEFVDNYIPYLQGTFSNLFFRGFIIGIIVFLIKTPLNL
jgi:hypothetical protein